MRKANGLILTCLLLMATSAFGITNLAKPGVIWEVESGSTALNVNGGGFDILNPYFPADLACTAATGNNPICTSATFGNFDATDNAAWVFIKQGTAHWTPGLYKLVDECVASVWAQSVGVGACTTGQGMLDATIGHAVQPADVVLQGVSDANSTGFIYNAFVANTAAGVSDQTSPTGGTVGIDYSQQAAAHKSYADFGCTTATPASCSSVGAPFSVKDQGNLLHDTTTGTGAYCLQGWYEIVSVAVAAATLDRIATDGVHACVAGQFYAGGAVPLGSSTANQTDVLFFQQAMGTNGTGASHIFVKNATYTLAQSLASLTAGGTQASIILEGYNSLRGDTPTGTNRPTFAFGSSYNMAVPAAWRILNLIVTGSYTTSHLLILGGYSRIVNVKALYSGTVAGNAAVSLGGTGAQMINSEAVSLRGPAVTFGSYDNSVVFGSFLHGSNIGIASSGTTSGDYIINNIIENNASSGINVTSAQNSLVVIGNTLYNGGATQTGIGINLNATGFLNLTVLNNIITGFATGISQVDTSTIGYGDYNNFYNNGANVSSGLKWQNQAHTYYVNPTFAGVAQYAGTGASTATNTLTDNAVNFTTYSIVNSGDFCNITADTGSTLLGQYLITGVGTHALTLSPSPGTLGAVAYQIITGHNLAVGASALKTGGFPGAFPASPAVSTGYFGIGAVQPSGAGGGGQHNTGYIQ
jgi:hypothetical protein